MLIGKFGTDALAAHQITRQFFDIAITIALALTQATTARVGKAAGEGNLKNIKLSSYTSVFVGLVFMLIVSSFYIIYPESLIALDININSHDNFEVVYYAKQLLFIVAIFQIFDCIRLAIMGSLRGLKDTKIPLYLTILSYWVVGFPTAYIFGFILNFGVIGIWCGLLFGIVIGALILIYRLKAMMTDKITSISVENAA